MAEEIVLIGDVGGRGVLSVFVDDREVLCRSWEDVGSAGIDAIIEMAIEFGAALNVPVRDDTK